MKKEITDYIFCKKCQKDKEHYIICKELLCNNGRKNFNKILLEIEKYQPIMDVVIVASLILKSNEVIGWKE